MSAGAAAVEGMACAIPAKLRLDAKASATTRLKDLLNMVHVS
jgi:hypothetical protein